MCRDWGKGKGVYYAGRITLFKPACILMVALGIVFLIGQVMKKAETVSMVSNVIALGMSFLSGVFVPIEFLGDGIIKVAHFLPAYWYIMGARLIDSGNYQSSPDLLWRYMGIEVLFAACFAASDLL